MILMILWFFYVFNAFDALDVFYVNNLDGFFFDLSWVWKIQFIWNHTEKNLYNFIILYQMISCYRIVAKSLLKPTEGTILLFIIKLDKNEVNLKLHDL